MSDEVFAAFNFQGRIQLGTSTLASYNLYENEVARAFLFDSGGRLTSLVAGYQVTRCRASKNAARPSIKLQFNCVYLHVHSW